MKKVIIKIEGMMCQHCVNRVDGILKAVDGVSSVAVDLAKGEAIVHADAIDEKVLFEAIEDAGFDISGCIAE